MCLSLIAPRFVVGVNMFAPCWELLLLQRSLRVSVACSRFLSLNPRTPRLLALWRLQVWMKVSLDCSKYASLYPRRPRLPVLLRLLVGVKESLDCLKLLSQILHLSRTRFNHLIHVFGRRHLHVHVCLALLVLLLLLVFALLCHLLRSLLLLHMRMRRSCTVLAIRGRTRVGSRVPREGGVPKVGFCGTAEDLRPVSEVEAGVNFRPAGGVREQVAGSLPRKQPGTGTRLVRGGAVTPSLHPEVPGFRFVSRGRGLGIRQSVGWTTVCETARSGIWVPKGKARACTLPENLEHLRVGWRPQGSYETAWATPGHDCLCPYQYGRGAAVRPQTDDAIWDGVIGLRGRVAPLLSPWCARGNVPTGVNLNRYSGSGSYIRWHSDNESLFGPPNQPKFIVSVSSGHSVVFQVRCAPNDVPSSITLDHGDFLVMGGSAQVEYEHCM